MRRTVEFLLNSLIIQRNKSIKYFPMRSTHIKWDEIQKAEVIKYDFVGYGIRFSNDYGTRLVPK